MTAIRQIAKSDRPKNAQGMTSCTTTTVKLPDGSETTTTAPDPLIWVRAFDTAEVVAAREIHAEK